MSVTIRGRIEKETEKAFLVVVDGEKIWLPKSQVVADESDPLEEGSEEVDIAITEWIAREKGLD